MKRRFTLLIALVLSAVIASLLSFDSTVEAQNQLRPIADTGVVMLGPNQELRVTVAVGDATGDSIRVRFRQLEYMQTACNDNVCKSAVASQTMSNPIILTPSEAGWATFPSSVTGQIVRFVVLANKKNVNVNTIVFDTSTQRIVSIVHTYQQNIE